MKTIEAVFDGMVFKPSEPVSLEPNTRVQITIETTARAAGGASFLQVASNLNLEGPADWSTNLEEYLYGKANRGT
jgi:predicted DNA-binding antitoxin AbrB/MazE fold protein